MTTVPIPENAIGHIGMVATLKRVKETELGKLVVLREPAGFVTALVASAKPVFAWLAESLGEPVDCRGHPSRSLYVADRCLVPMGDLTPSQTTDLIQGNARQDFEAALEDVAKIIDLSQLPPDDLDALLYKAASQCLIQKALEIVSVPVALREIGFAPTSETGEVLEWATIHEGVELCFIAGQKWFTYWGLLATGVSSRKWTCDESHIPNEAPRGEIFLNVLDTWRRAYSTEIVPSLLELGAIYEQHLEEMRTLGTGLPNLWVSARVFRQILKWLRESHSQSDSTALLTLSYSKGMLRMDVGGTGYGCPAGGHWADECNVRLVDLMKIVPHVSRRREILLERSANFITVNGYRIADADAPSLTCFFITDDFERTSADANSLFCEIPSWTAPRMRAKGYPEMTPGCFYFGALGGTFWVLGMAGGVASTEDIEVSLRTGGNVRITDGPFDSEGEADYAFDCAWESPE